MLVEIWDLFGANDLQGDGASLDKDIDGKEAEGKWASIMSTDSGADGTRRKATMQFNSECYSSQNIF